MVQIRQELIPVTAFLFFGDLIMVLLEPRLCKANGKYEQSGNTTHTKYSRLVEAAHIIL